MNGALRSTVITLFAKSDWDEPVEAPGQNIYQMFDQRIK